MFLALHDDKVIGCAGRNRDTDRPERAENALTTAVRRRLARPTASPHTFKRRTLHWAALDGLEEIYTWTQAGNSSMLRLNEHLGYVTTHDSVTVSQGASPHDVTTTNISTDGQVRRTQDRRDTRRTGTRDPAHAEESGAMGEGRTTLAESSARRPRGCGPSGRVWPGMKRAAGPMRTCSVLEDLMSRICGRSGAE